jgi:hypothetical protein
LLIYRRTFIGDKNCRPWSKPTLAARVSSVLERFEKPNEYLATWRPFHPDLVQKMAVLSQNWPNTDQKVTFHTSDKCTL